MKLTDKTKLGSHGKVLSLWSKGPVGRISWFGKSRLEGGSRRRAGYGDHGGMEFEWSLAGMEL